MKLSKRFQQNCRGEVERWEASRACQWDHDAEKDFRNDRERRRDCIDCQNLHRKKRNHFVERKHTNGTESWMVHCPNILMARSEYRIREKSCIRDLSQQNSVNKKQCELKITVDSSTFKVDLKVLHNGVFLQLLCSKKKKGGCVKKRGLKKFGIGVPFVSSFQCCSSCNFLATHAHD